jgi:glycerol-3-phosphate cytidylyltransferase
MPCADSVGAVKTVITYGTFDLLHYGHIEILRRAKQLALGGDLIVAVSSDEFNAGKGKTSHLPFAKRKELVEAIRYVDVVIPEEHWEQKVTDIEKYAVDVFVMGDDWEGKFDDLRGLCDVVYLARTPSISSTAIKEIVTDAEGVPEAADLRADSAEPR